MSRAVVLNTRPAHQAAELSRLLEQAGLRVLEVPATELVGEWNALEMADIGEQLRARAYKWVVLSSQNAARFFLQAVPEADLTGLPVVCGRATARALGVAADTTLDRFSAAAALEVLAPLCRPGERVLVPRAAGGRDELVDGLREAGVLVDAPLCYAARAVPPQQLRAAIGEFGAIEAVALCSPSAVAALGAAFPLSVLNGTSIVCLGQTTADAARAAGLRVDGVAEQTSMVSLVEAIQHALEVAA